MAAEFGDVFAVPDVRLGVEAPGVVGEESVAESFGGGVEEMGEELAAFAEDAA